MKQQPIPRSQRAAVTVASAPLDLESGCEYVHSNAKTAAHWRVGLEYELIGFDKGSYQRISRIRVQELLRSLSERQGIPTLEDGSITALRMPYGDITLEPGGQIEFSGQPERRLADNERGLQRFLTDLRAQTTERGMFFVALGFDPLRNLDEQSWIDKQRYRIMRPYLQGRGGHAWDMMTRTAAMQVNIDYGDDLDLGRKYVLGNRLGPIVAAMFANSPYAGGIATGLKSTRYAVWLDTDPDRTGPGPESLSERFDLREYVRAVLEVPVLFLERNGALLDRAGQRLTDLSDARVSDFRDLLSMIFTEARIREYVEMRSADGGQPANAFALMALWKGLTYDSSTLQDALDVTPRLDRAGYRALQMAVARDALAARCEGVDVLTTARVLLSLAMAGLKKVAPDELRHLDGLAQNVIDDGVSPADILLNDCGSDVERAMAAATVA
ncbi:MAG: glutamate-cysteine ligase family protein [Candidatus Eremiobacteraeota bacterium]|nr:glutamate-cysteine ligase family protein [Candidatus Eremiobacteraeota bacterium]